MTRSILLVGPGWLGGPTASLLARQGATVYTLHRSAGAPPDGCIGVSGDIARAATDSDVRAALPATVDHVIACVAPSRARGDDYALYPTAAAGAVALAAALHARSLLWVSSTGIYDRQDGSEVDERTAITPRDARVQALADAEAIIAKASQTSVPRVARIVRAAGLYGPGRDPAPRFAASATAADVWCNFAWRDDVRDAIAHLLDTPPSAPVEIFNCADGHPVQAGEITMALTGRAPVPPDAAPLDGRTRAGRSSQRIRVDALRATGWAPTMPTVFDGLRALGHDIA